MPRRCDNDRQRCRRHRDNDDEGNNGDSDNNDVLLLLSDSNVKQQQMLVSDGVVITPSQGCPVVGTRLPTDRLSDGEAKAIDCALRL